MESREIDFQGDYTALGKCLWTYGIKRLLWIHGKSAERLKVGQYLTTGLRQMQIEVESFTDFTANPDYESVVKGVNSFRQFQADGIIATGGGSAIDVAKCIKLYSVLEPGECYLQQELRPVRTPLIVVPTTAGTGSEVTHYAVIYYQGEKCSVTSKDILPNAYLLDAAVLEELPEYQRKVTMLDALCHGVESYWSVNATLESRRLSLQTVKQILSNASSYLQNTSEGNRAMLRAANMAGKCIDVTQTTAGHAMSYVLTKRYGIAHGQAVALCTGILWQAMEPQGILTEEMDALGKMFLQYTGAYGAKGFNTFLKKLDLPLIKGAESDIPFLVDSVNPVRLQNHPVKITQPEFYQMYKEIIGR